MLHYLLLSARCVDFDRVFIEVNLRLTLLGLSLEVLLEVVMAEMLPGHHL